MDFKILCIIPARGGSKGVPGKNIKLLNKKPLIQYSFDFARNIDLFSTICISTDSEEIANVAHTIGLEVPFIRPSEYATDNSSSFELIKHAIDFYESNYGMVYDYVCLLQPTVPFRDIELIRPKLINFLNNEEADTLISVRIIPHQFSPEWAFQENPNSHSIEPCSNIGIKKRRQDLKPFYYRDGALYVFRVNNIKVSKSIYGKYIVPLVLEDNNNINIDTLDDWFLAENFIKMNCIEK